MMDKDSKLEKNRISILGCGWLGFQLAQRLLEQHISSHVKGSTTSADKIKKFTEKGIQGFLLQLKPEFENTATDLESFFNTDTLIISLPPRLSKNEPGFYQQQIEAVVREIKKSPVRDLIFISSTGIYPELNRIMTEDDVTTPEQSASPDMVEAENLIQTLRPERNVSILRLGGLMGYNRIPGKYVKGQKNMTTGSIPVNYIHRDDAVAIILTIIKSGISNQTFNIVAPIHTTRREIYEASCAQFGWETPTFAEPDSKPDYKIISAEKFAQHYDYAFKFPDPLQFYYSLEDSDA
ncbi:NAD-dependent dehydratase [Dyadobacter sp. CY326]|uniref:NAD-dependent dehydratase n=1 Tax=Dyadobacter sp. CY326 TaxID=2907300 RepID=UPI001F462313|nr:NAD-dependent dehydratase [Dyadobacter sp. CY326]MCE7067667.1 NAD-dependent dehydratase [Dyadobacter sp. CY326]